MLLQLFERDRERMLISSCRLDGFALAL